MDNPQYYIKTKVSLVVHLLFCAAIFLVPLLVMYRNEATEHRHYTEYMVRAGMLVFLFYINYLFLTDRFLLKKQFVPYIIINILLIIGVVLLQNFIFDSLIVRPRPFPPLPTGMEVDRRPPGPPPFYEIRRLSDYVLMVLAVGMSVALKATSRWYRDSINLETIKASQLEADLKNLRSQLNPHFLFNTLNNIYSLIAIDPNKAQTSVHHLSSLLRYILYENERFVPIDKELQFTNSYIDLMRLRLNSDVKLNILIKNDNCDKQIASLLFITLIENAFKHGINNGADSFIDIKISIEPNSGVLCTVENSLGESKGNIEAKNSGIGLANLRKRLELLYPNSHDLQIKKGNDRFCALLYINFVSS